ncbi:Cyclin-U4-1 [Platanthera guangdongensis]|uniref:Cyclin n=1 Tax=Platanthera guangdongensis TaxID=2320717 RepID=A0ABR2LS74_9ASPA
MARGDLSSPLIVSVLAALFKRTIRNNDPIAASSGQPVSEAAKMGATIFSGEDKVEIPIEFYLHKILVNTYCSPSSYVVAFIYLDRFFNRHPSVLLNSFNVHRLVVTAILTAVKFSDEYNDTNAYYAKVAEISVSEMNELEVCFLFGVQFDLHVRVDEYDAYCSFLESQIESMILDT